MANAKPNMQHQTGFVTGIELSYIRLIILSLCVRWLVSELMMPCVSIRSIRTRPEA